MKADVVVVKVEPGEVVEAGQVFLLVIYVFVVCLVVVILKLGRPGWTGIFALQELPS